MGTFGGNKKVKAPVYQEWQGNEYTDRARQNVGTYGDWVGGNWQSLVKAPTAQDFTGIVNKAYNTTWDDFLQDYNTQANAIASRNYNRFGGLGSTPSMYTQDMLNKQENDLASRLGSQMYQMADQLAGNQFNRNLTSLGTVYGMYNDAGNTINDLDKNNWQIRNRNIEAQYVADAQNAQNRFNLGNALTSGIGGALTGLASGGVPGAILGGVGGLATGALSGQNTGAIGTMFNSQSPAVQWLGNINTTPNLNLNTKAQQIVNTPTTYRTYMGGRY